MEFKIIFFILGLQLTIQLISSLYRVIDLWYRIGDFILPVSRSIVLNTLSIVFIWWYLEGSREIAFLRGCIFFLCFHISVFWIGKAMVKLKRRCRDWGANKA